MLDFKFLVISKLGVIELAFTAECLRDIRS